jgi:hypothetical protein
VAERANDEILQLAVQGNLQALSVYLNRHLIPSGAHVKVKQREDALHVLIVVMSESDNAGLINTVQQLLIRLNPAQIKRAKVYTQILGQKQANLRQQFSIPSAAAELQVPKVPTSLDGMANASQTQVRRDRYASSVPSPPPEAKHPGNKAPKTSHSGSSVRGASDSKPKTRRYSVADFLTQATRLEDLKVLRDHPFFTGTCPHCRNQYSKGTVPPTYWDCSKCGWRDDLSQAMPPSSIHHDSSQTSITESKRLGDYLVEAGLLTVSQIEVALADQVTTQLRFGDVLIRRGWVKEETIEYLMKKVILPERIGHQNAASYLESSRSLLKTLFKVRPGSQLQNSLPIGPTVASIENASPPHQQSRQDSSSHENDSNNGSSENGVTSISPKVPFVPSVKLANERETLILPDVELDELDSYLNGSQRKEKL